MTVGYSASEDSSTVSAVSAVVSFDVYVPQSTSISLSDSTLNRFGDKQGDDIVSCSSRWCHRVPVSTHSCHCVR